MPHYLVTWRIDAYEDTPEAAARSALEIMRNPDRENTATVFEVLNKENSVTTEVDLLEPMVEQPDEVAE